MESSDALVRQLRAAGCVYAEEEAQILVSAARSAVALVIMTRLRCQGYPLEHIVGWARFCGLRIAVRPGVFVPRLRSEFLVRMALVALADGPRLDPGPKILDLCCGSGAVAAALGAALGTARGAADEAGRERGERPATIGGENQHARSMACELYAADLDSTAVGCARENLLRYRGRVYCGDLFAPLPATLRGTFDVIAANAPYVPTAEIPLMPREAREHEPERALDGGVDGLGLHRRIAAQAPDWLRPGGALLLESSARQAHASARILAIHGFAPRIDSDGDRGGTVVTGILKPR